MGKYPLTEAEKQRVLSFIHKNSPEIIGKSAADFNHFNNWIKNEDPTFHRSIQHKLRDVWEEFKKLATSILEGIGIVSAAVIVTPIVGIVEGVSEGLENGLAAGVEKAFNEMGDFLGRLFK